MYLIGTKLSGQQSRKTKGAHCRAVAAIIEQTKACQRVFFGKNVDTSSRENRTPPSGAPNADAIPAADAAESISRCRAAVGVSTILKGERSKRAHLGSLGGQQKVASQILLSSKIGGREDLLTREIVLPE